MEEVEEMVRTWNKESNSSNENIIKACIGMCLTDANEQRFNDYNTTLKDCLDWLKKQGEQKPNPYTGTSFEYNGHIWGMCARDNGVEILFDGELKAFLSLEKSFIYPIHPQPYFAPKSAMEAIKEEKVDNQNCVKPADKVEPKFKVGDYIKHNKANIICKVLSVNVGFYRLINILGGDEMELSNAEKNFHLWTIQDGKDGDILAFKNNISGIIICKSPTDYDTGSYCRLVRGNLINKEESGWDSTLLVPATKEQRDQLEKAMADAGYTFDFEKKELKKIEHKLANWITNGIDVDKIVGEVKDPYEQCVQYPSIKDGIEAHASIYSFNIQSQLFPQLTKEQQALWRKEIEQACISGGDAGVTLARDQRYKENLEVKEVKVRGYLVRDKDDYTVIYAEKPHRGKTEWVDGNDSCLMTINDTRLVPDIEFEDEPIEVEVTLKRLNTGE